MDADALLHPRGPLPPGVYWRRRLLTLGAVVLVLALGARACGGDGEPAARTSPTPAPSRSAAPRTTAPARPTAGASTPATAPVCRPADLLLGVKADDRSYATGSRPVFRASLTNRGAAPCRADVAARSVTVRSGNDRVWSSGDCPPAPAPNVVTLAPGAATVVLAVTWPRVRSAPGCPSGLRAVTAGTYKVSATVGSLTSTDDTFTVG
ncbi:MAG TPA: hypothetical protein VFQ85_14245 [Mycobacteriales bacterium]|jgi:hypothetical protein|nr:hypothetical protein [Mycobacteriales bacterium]